MSILIKDMAMPKNCHKCPLLYVTSICDGSKDCPLVEVPPHGRLIDADALVKELLKRSRTNAMPLFGQMLDSAPTIIESEE